MWNDCKPSSWWLFSHGSFPSRSWSVWFLHFCFPFTVATSLPLLQPSPELLSLSWNARKQGNTWAGNDKNDELVGGGEKDGGTWRKRGHYIGCLDERKSSFYTEAET